MRDFIDRFTTDILLLDRKAVFALLYTAAGLTGIFYLKDTESLAAFVSGSRFEDLGELIAHSPQNNLPALGWWVAVVTLFYFIIPAIVIKFAYAESLAD